MYPLAIQEKYNMAKIVVKFFKKFLLTSLVPFTKIVSMMQLKKKPVQWWWLTPKG